MHGHKEILACGRRVADGLEASSAAEQGYIPARYLASAALPAAAGLSVTTAVAPGAFSDGYRTAMLIAAAIAALGGLISWATIRGGRPGAAPRHPSPTQACTWCPPEAERVAAGAATAEP